VFGGEEYFCNSNTYCRLQNGCHCKGLEDLFMVFFQGTVTSTHYAVTHDTTNMNTDRVQQLMYKLCKLTTTGLALSQFLLLAR